MSCTGYLGISIYSIIILVFIYFHAVKHTEKKMLHSLYMLLLQATLIMLVTDMISRADGMQGIKFLVVNAANFLLFFLNPVIPSIWFLYVHYQVFLDRQKTKRLSYFLILINGINAVFIMISQRYGWLYYFDARHIYHRAWLFILPAAISILVVSAAEIFVILNRRNIEKKYLLSLLFFPLPPLICGVLQVFFYGIPLVLNGTAFSLLVAFVDIQNRSMDIDYLTGAYNRKKLDDYMQQKISQSNESRTFSAILIDVDNFKYINDTYGHIEGDHALETAVALLKRCIKLSDFVARYGGDEFCVILDVSDGKTLGSIVRRIEKNLKVYNEFGNELYSLHFSMGYAVYDPSSKIGLKKFQKQIDQLMYQDKRRNKKLPERAEGST